MSRARGGDCAQFPREQRSAPYSRKLSPKRLSSGTGQSFQAMRPTLSISVPADSLEGLKDGLRRLFSKLSELQVIVNERLKDVLVTDPIHFTYLGVVYNLTDTAVTTSLTIKQLTKLEVLVNRITQPTKSTQDIRTSDILQYGARGQPRTILPCLKVPQTTNWTNQPVYGLLSFVSGLTFSSPHHHTPGSERTDPTHSYI